MLSLITQQAWSRSLLQTEVWSGIECVLTDSLSCIWEMSHVHAFECLHNCACVRVCACGSDCECVPFNSCPVWYFIPQPTCLESMSKHICLNGMFPEQTMKIWPWYEYQWQPMIIGLGCFCFLWRCPVYRHLIKWRSKADINILFYHLSSFVFFCPPADCHLMKVEQHLLWV